MYKFGKKSRAELSTVDKRLQDIANELIKLMDVTVLEGKRSREHQDKLVRLGLSQTMNSKHLDGKALDLAPYPVDWEDRERFVYMLSLIHI